MIQWGDFDQPWCLYMYLSCYILDGAISPGQSYKIISLYKYVYMYMYLLRRTVNRLGSFSEVIWWSALKAHLVVIDELFFWVALCW